MKELYTLKKISNHVFGNVPEITITIQPFIQSTKTFDTNS